MVKNDDWSNMIAVAQDAIKSYPIQKRQELSVNTLVLAFSHVGARWIVPSSSYHFRRTHCCMSAVICFTTRQRGMVFLCVSRICLGGML